MTASDPTIDVTQADQWTPKTLMDACVHIRTLEAEREILRQEACRWRNEAIKLGHVGWLNR